MPIIEHDLLHPSPKVTKAQHKKKRLVQAPNSFFMDLKCSTCQTVATVFSHAHTVVLCSHCGMVLSTPTGGRAKITNGCSFRRKID